MMGYKEDQEAAKKTLTVTSPESGKTYTVQRDVEEGSIAHGIEKLRTGMDQVYIDKARARARSVR